MISKNLQLLVLVFLFSSHALIGQENKPTYFKKAKSFKKMPSMASRIADGTFIPAKKKVKEAKAMSYRGTNKIIPGKGLPIGKDPLLIDENSKINHPSSNPIITWDGTSESNWSPTDPTGAPSLDYFVNSWNMGYRIWDKEANALIPEASFQNLWPDYEEEGDPIVYYDAFADRFIITQFYGWLNASNGYGFLFAICEGNDPVNDEWYTYEFETEYFPDYPKYSVWSDGYYITTNYNSTDPTVNESVYVVDREKMIAGDSTVTMQGFTLPGLEYGAWFCPLGFNATGNELPPSGKAPIVYMQDDSWSGVDSDHLKLWTIDVDWDDADNSTISVPIELETEVFSTVMSGGLWENLTQPNGQSIGAALGFMMQMAQYRRFEDHNSVVLNHTVNLDENNDQSGIRWYELRQDDDESDWEIYQEGTFEQADGLNAWCGSMALDKYSNISLAYTVVSEEVNPSVRYTGRFASDPLGQMTVEEGVFQEGVQSSGNTRYGDYSQVSIDPTDDVTFWHIAEYFDNNARNNIIGSFKIAPSLSYDAGVVEVSSPTDNTLSTDEIITIELRNYGLDTISAIPVAYSVDGGDIVSETYEGIIPPMSSVWFSFDLPADLSMVGNTYEVTSYSDYNGDEDQFNDTSITFIKHLLPNDLGSAEIINPIDGDELDSEIISVLIKNYGGEAQSNFEVNYSVNNGPIVTEIVTETVEGPGELIYSFSVPEPFSEIGDYEIMSYTSLSEDSDLSNDTTMSIVTKAICAPFADCSFQDGFQLFELNNISNVTECSMDGYGDYSDLLIYLAPDIDYSLKLTTGYGDQYVKVWIDLNDNFLFEDDEIIINDFVLGPGLAAQSITDSISFIVPASSALGEHLLRAKSNWNASVPEDPCQGTVYGETEDYTVMIDPSVGITDVEALEGEFMVKSHSFNRFELIYKDDKTNSPLILTIHNSNGKEILNDILPPSNGNYSYDLDMNYMASGVYLIRIGDKEYGKIKKIVVQ